MVIQARYPGTCRKCGCPIRVGDAINWERGRGATHVTCPATRAIGEARAEYGIGRVPTDVDQTCEALAELEADSLMGITRRPVRAGEHYAPAGTTEGVRTPGARCGTCGRPADWNPGAGRYLCSRHWDEY